jgi:hypothetical protein
MSLLECRLAGINDSLKESFDLFLVSASYESRSRCIADSLAPDRIGRSLVAMNRRPHPRLRENAKYLLGKLPNSKTVELDKDNPVFGADNLFFELAAVFQGPPKRAFVDITTFTHEAAIIVVQITKLLARPEDRVRFGYVGVEEYSPGVPDEEKWLSKGTRDIRSVLGLPGELLPSRKIHLIVLVGHETDRARALVDAYEPSLVSLGYSTKESSISSRNFEANQHFHKKMTSLYPKSEHFTFSANDINESKSAIESLISKFPEHNTVIAPMNSKISAIGVAMAALENVAIQICYAQPELYNADNFSLPKDTCFLFKIKGIGGDS